MDEQLKEEILKFFQKNRGVEITFPEDWVKDLEEHLVKEGFDLETVIQYN